MQQPGVEFCMQRLRERQWVHIFPEGKVRYSAALELFNAWQNCPGCQRGRGAAAGGGILHAAIEREAVGAHIPRGEGEI